MSEQLKVGDRLWMVERRGRHDHGGEVVVTKVGRKWAYVSATGQYAGERGRIDLEELIIDGGNYSSPGRCFRSQAEYEERLRLAEAWDGFHRAVRDSIRRPAHLTLEQITAVHAALFTTPIKKATPNA